MELLGNGNMEIEPTKNACGVELPPGEGGYLAYIRGGATGKSEKLPCPRVKFLKMIADLGVKFS